MKSHLILPLLTLIATSLPLCAAVDDILENTATFKPKVTLSDVYADEIIVEKDDGETFRSVATNQRIALSIVANLDGAVTGPINADTEVGVTAGGFSHVDTLGNAFDYKPGGKKATFVYTTDVETASGDTKEVRVGTIVYAWTAKTLTVTVKIMDVEAAGVSDIASGDYIDAAAPGEKVAILDDPLDVTVDFGAASGSRGVFVRGFAKVQTKSFGAPTSDDYEEFDLADVDLKGAADTTSPVVKSTFSAAPDSAREVAVSGTASDLQDVDVTAVTVNNVDAVGAIVTVSEPSEANVSTWSVSGIALKKGANLVAVTLADPDGNLTTVTKRYTIK